MKILKRLKYLTLGLLLLGTPFSTYGAACSLDWSKLYFKNFEGNFEYNPQTKKMEKFYEEYHQFKGGNIPVIVTINIPFKGDCSDFKVSEVSVFRKIGKQEFPGGEEEHSKHALEPKNLKYEDVPFQTVKPIIKRTKGEVVLEKFEVLKGLETLGNNQHAWKYRYEIFYKGENGVDNKKVHEVDLPLVH